MGLKGAVTGVPTLVNEGYECRDIQLLYPSVSSQVRCHLPLGKGGINPYLHIIK